MTNPIDHQFYSVLAGLSRQGAAANNNATYVSPTPAPQSNNNNTQSSFGVSTLQSSSQSMNSNNYSSTPFSSTTPTPYTYQSGTPSFSTAPQQYPTTYPTQYGAPNYYQFPVAPQPIPVTPPYSSTPPSGVSGIGYNAYPSPVFSSASTIVAPTNESIVQDVAKNKSTPAKRDISHGVNCAQYSMHFRMVSSNAGTQYISDLDKVADPMIIGPLQERSLDQIKLPCQEVLSKHYSDKLGRPVTISNIKEWISAEYGWMDSSLLPEKINHTCIVSPMAVESEQPNSIPEAHYVPILNIRNSRSSANSEKSQVIIFYFDSSGQIHGTRFLQQTNNKDHLRILMKGEDGQDHQFKAIRFSDQAMLATEQHDPTLAREVLKNNLTIVAFNVTEVLPATGPGGRGVLADQLVIAKTRSMHSDIGYGLVSEGAVAQTQYITTSNNANTTYKLASQGTCLSITVVPVTSSVRDVTALTNRCDTICEAMEMAIAGYASTEQARIAYLKKFGLSTDLQPHVFIHKATQRWAMDFTTMGANPNQTVAHCLDNHFSCPTKKNKKEYEYRQLTQNPNRHNYSISQDLPLDYLPIVITHQVNKKNELTKKLRVYDLRDAPATSVIYRISAEDVCSPTSTVKLGSDAYKAKAEEYKQEYALGKVKKAVDRQLALLQLASPTTQPNRAEFMNT